MGGTVVDTSSSSHPLPPLFEWYVTSVRVFFPTEFHFVWLSFKYLDAPERERGRVSWVDLLREKVLEKLILPSKYSKRLRLKRKTCLMIINLYN